MKKADAIKWAGGTAALAAIFDITPGAVSQWDDDTIPPLRVYKLRELRPEWFNKDGTPKPPPMEMANAGAA